MGHDAAFLVGRDDQRRQACSTPFFLQRRYLLFQTRRRSSDIVLG
jgi:hypothetical protein